MKRRLPFLVLLAALAWIAAALVPPRNPGEFDVTGFGRLPALVDGRIKPLDTVARTSLLALQGRQRVVLPNGKALTPIEWLVEVTLGDARPDTYQTFEIVNPDVLALFHLSTTDGAAGKRYSFEQLRPHLDELERQYRLTESVESAARTPFQKAVNRLVGGVTLYQGLRHSLVLPEGGDLLAALTARTASPKVAGPDPLLDLAPAAELLETYGALRMIPPAVGAVDQTAWSKAGTSLRDALGGAPTNPALLVYLTLAQTWRQQTPAAFNEQVSRYRILLAERFAPQLVRTEVEVRFNAAAPFYLSMVLFVGAFLLAVISWLRWPGTLGPAAFRLVAVAFVLTTVGIGLRMWLEGRPPVTNLYSSALFVGWGAVGLCLLLETTFRNGIGSVAAGVVGFCTLLIAHFLSLQGDTMEMMRAVLDSNFWLATHVVAVTAGYSATYLAGFLALIYVIRGVFTRSLDQRTADAMARMVYGVVCFATLFSLLGTVLGGIWADQSWGRFWGWDPKENGALIIVIWNAIILHARWGRMVGPRGLMSLAIFGNIVTSWSWFGVNMLGVGLHSYGFMDAAFWWLLAFILSQLALIAVAALPQEKWRSFAHRDAIPRERNPGGSPGRAFTP